MNKYSKVEELLRKYKMININIQNMTAEIEFLGKEDGMVGISYDGIRVSETNEFRSATENIAIANMEKIHYLERLIEKAKLEIESIDRALEGLEEREKTVIIERYINSKQWWQVSGVVFLGERQCKRIRSEAIKKIVTGMYG